MSMTPESLYNLAMTSDNYTDASGNTFRSSASSTIDGTRLPYKAFDGTGATGEFDCWHPSSGVPQWLKLQLSTPVRILAFTLKKRSAFIEHPVAFSFQGSNNDTDWDTLAQLTWTDNNESSKDFTIPEYATAYSYFRWYITEVPSSPYGVIAKVIFTDVSVESGTSLIDLVYKRVQQNYSQGTSTYTADAKKHLLALNIEANNNGSSGSGSTATTTTTGTVVLTDVQSSSSGSGNRNAQLRLSILDVNASDTVTLENRPYTGDAKQLHILFDANVVKNFSNVAFAAYEDISHDHKYEYTSSTSKTVLCICWNENTYGQPTSASATHSGSYTSLFEQVIEDAQSSLLVGIYDVQAGDTITLSTSPNGTAYTSQIYAIYDVTLLSGSRYLIEDGGDYYTIVNDTLTNVGSTLNAQLFADYGLNTIPEYSEYSTLTSPSILCWNDEEEVSMTATVLGIPNPQIVYSQNVDMTNSTITGIDSVEITSDDNTLFAMSFDSGTTWWNYVNNQWVQLSTSSAGQDRDSIEDIPTNAWNQKAITGHIMFRFTLLDEDAYVTEIFINFTN